MISPLKKSKTVEEDGKLLTSRKMNPVIDATNPNSQQASQVKRSIRNPDFIRHSLLSARQSTILADQQNQQPNRSSSLKESARKSN